MDVDILREVLAAHLTGPESQGAHWVDDDGSSAFVGPAGLAVRIAHDYVARVPRESEVILHSEYDHSRGCMYCGSPAEPAR